MILERYALFGALASGGMATVHLGRLLGAAGFSRTVAIKRLHEQFASDPDFVAAFLDEARLAARIRHPNVVPTLDVVATGGRLFLVMEYVEGESLSRLLKTMLRSDMLMPMPIAAAIMVGALSGLHAAHEACSEKGEPLMLVHRDVSPQNILVGTDGVPRVLDFGVAKAIGRLQSTDSGRLKGKAAYMAPEQVRGANVDRRTDVFAASIVLWEMLTGERLFDADNQAMALDRVLSAPIDPPSRHAEDIPPALDEIVLRGLARNVDERWQTARDMAQALEACLTLPSPTHIGAWVESIAGDSLHERAERVAEVESSTSDPGTRASEALATLQVVDGAATTLDPLPSSPASQTGSRSAAIPLSASMPPHQPRRRSLTPVLISAAALVAVAASVTAWMLGRGSASSPEVAAPAIAPAHEPTASAPPEPAPPAEPSAEPDAALAATPPSAAPPAAKKKPSRAAPAVDCSVPFVRDELGRKIWKRECL